MKKLIIPLIIIFFALSGCYDETEPDNLSYVTAVGIDKSEKQENNYSFTIQFAKPSAISGGASQEGGKGGEIVENMVVESPTLYSAINTMNHILSKNISMAHIKLIVFSEEMARDGVRNITEEIIRSQEIRPNIYFAVSLDKAQDYLKNVKPVIEINPTKYYELTFQRYTYGGIPKNPSYDFIFNMDARTHDNVLPLVGTAEEEGGEQQSSGGGGQSESSGNSQSKSFKNKLSEAAPITLENFEYGTKNYIAGQVGEEIKNKSEAMGMAIFHDEKMVGIAGSNESILYNILGGTYEQGYLTFKTSNSEIPVTVRAKMDTKPKVSYDKKKNLAKIKIALECDFVSMAAKSHEETNVSKFEQEASSALSDAAKDFLEKMRDEYRADVIGIGEAAKLKFLTEKDFYDFDWESKFTDLDYDISSEIKIRRSGLIIRD